MDSRVCRLHGPHDIRIETETVGEMAADQVLVRIGAGGICGSDLHYFHDGGFGSIRVREPIILGHEVGGTVEAVGGEVTNVAPGDRIGLNPSRPCNACKFCDEALFQHCLNMRFYGSAMPFPHEQGAFRDLIVADACQCQKVGADTSVAEAACAEPLAVGLHARSRAGSLAGKRVLVTGAGPIGSLLVAVARQGAAAEIVVTDLQDATLAIAKIMGASKIINVGSDPEALDPYMIDKGSFDVAFECSASPVALKAALTTVRPQGTIVQVGVAGDVPVPLNVLVSKEIALKGTQRFHGEYAQAVRLISSGEIDVKPIITDSYPVAQALEALNRASDRSKAMKVQLCFA